MGNLSKRLGNYKKAAEHYFSALKVFDSLDNKYQIALINGNLGNLYMDQKDYDKAIKYHLNALDQFTELGNKNAMASMMPADRFIIVSPMPIDAFR